MWEEIGSPEATCDRQHLSRHLGGSSFLRMTGLGEPAIWHKRRVAAGRQ